MFDDVSEQLRSLAELVIDAGVDVYAVSRMLAIDYYSEFI